MNPTVSEASDWKNEAVNLQQQYYETYQGRIEFKKDGFRFIKTFVGFCMFGNVADVAEMEPNVAGQVEGNGLEEVEGYVNLYDQKKRDIINIIYDQMMKLRNEKHADRIYLGHVNLLYNKNYENSESQDAIECIKLFNCSFDANLSTITQFYFIEDNGRVYRNWNDFVENNMLPPCEYCFPKNGLYLDDMNDIILNRLKIRNLNDRLNQMSRFGFAHSPATKLSTKLLKVADMVGSVAAIGAIGVSALATGPLIGAAALGTGIGATVYGVGRSVFGLTDRAYHEQSNSICDEEARMHWLNIGASSLSGASGILVSKTGKIVSAFGRFGSYAARSIQVLNATVLIVDVVSLSNSIYSVYLKHERGQEIDHMDVLNITIQVFCLYGTILNVRQIHRDITSATNAPLSVSKKLTKTQKRNLLRKRAKARARGEVVHTGVKTVEVHSNSKTYLANGVSKLPFQIFRQLCPSAEVIWIKFRDIIDNCKDYYQGKISLDKFLVSVTEHMTNLILILKDDYKKLKPLFVKLGFIKNNSDRNNISIIVDNGVTESNSDIEEIISTINDEPENEGSQGIIDYRLSTDHPTFQQVLYEVLESLISESNICDLIAGDVLKMTEVYRHTIHFLTESTISEMKEQAENYKKSYSVILNLTNDAERAKSVFKDQASLRKIFYKAVKTISENNKNQLYAELFDLFDINSSTSVTVNNENGCSILSTINIQLSELNNQIIRILFSDENISTCYVKKLKVTTIMTDFLTHKIIDKIKEFKIDFEEIKSLLGEEEAKDIFKGVNICIDNDATLFASAVKILGLQENLEKLIAEAIIHLEEIFYLEEDKTLDIFHDENIDDTTPTFGNESDLLIDEQIQVDTTNKDIAKHGKILLLANKLVQKLLENNTTVDSDINKVDVFQKVTIFVTHKFKMEITEVKDIYSELKDKDIRMLFKTVLSNTDGDSMFHNVFKKLWAKDEEDLLTEFAMFISETTIDVNNVCLWTSIVTDQGVQAHEYFDNGNLSDNEYIEKVREIYGIHLDSNTPIQRGENIILISLPSDGGYVRYIIFFSNPEQSAGFSISYSSQMESGN